MERLNLDKVKIMAAAATLAMFAGTACAHMGVEVYGEVNKVFEQVWTNRQDTGVIADNNYSPSRLGVMSSAHLNKCVTFGGVAELEFIPNNTRLVSQLQTEDLDNHVVLVNKVDAWVSGGMWGKLSLGLGQAASYGITDISYSGTNQTSLGSSVANNAGGMIFAVKGANALITNPNIDVVFSALNGVGDIDAVNGVLNTKDRVRYDTADWMGFKLGVSYGNTTHQFTQYSTQLSTVAQSRRTFFDVALRYAGCWDDFMVGAGVAGAWFNRDGTTADLYSTVTTGAHHNQSAWSGSVAVEHKPTGLNASVAGGEKRKFVSSQNHYRFWYVELGDRLCLTHYGRTNIAIDYFQSKDAVVNGDKGRSFGLGITQELNKIHTALYASLRNYKYNDVPGVHYEDIVAGSVGVQFKFGAML